MGVSTPNTEIVFEKAPESSVNLIGSATRLVFSSFLGKFLATFIIEPGHCPKI